MTNTKHTPTPWHTYKQTVGYAVDAYDRETSHTGQIRIVSKTSEANAEHIVRCVNSHDELVAALREIAHSAECNGGGFLKRADLLNVVRRHGEQARAALAKVEG
jgi:hypothetical protein